MVDDGNVLVDNTVVVDVLAVDNLFVFVVLHTHFHFCGDLISV